MPNVTPDNVTFTPVGGTALSSITLSSFAIGSGANRFLLVGVSQWKASDTEPTAIFNTSESLTAHDNATVSEAPGIRRVTILRRIAPSNVTANIVVSWTSSVDEAVVGATSWTGVDQTTPLGTAVKNSGSTGNTSSVVVSNTSGDVVHDVVSADGGSAAAAVANQTSRWKAIAAASTTEGAGQSATGAGSNITCTWSSLNQGAANAFFSHIGVAIQQAAAGATPFFGDTKDSSVRPDLARVKGERTLGSLLPAQTKLFGKDKFFGDAGMVVDYDWPNPQIPRRALDLLTQTDSSEFWMLRDTFFGGAGQPETQKDFPNPLRPGYPVSLRTWLVSLLQTTLAPVITQNPFHQSEWPNPVSEPYPVGLRTWLYSVLPTTLAIVPSPFTPIDWAVPRGYPYPVALRTWLYSVLPTTLTTVPFYQTDWPVPRGYSYPIDLRTGLYSVLLTTLSIPPSVQTPFSQTDWPVIRWARHPHQGFVTGQPQTLVGKDRFFGAAGQPPTNYDWPVPQAKPYPNALRTWFNTKIPPRLVPFTPQEWKTPRGVWPSTLLSFATGTNLALFYPEVSPLPPPPTAVDDDWGMVPGPSPTPVKKPPHLQIRTRHGKGTFHLGLPQFHGRGRIVASDEEDELLLFLLADET